MGIKSYVNLAPRKKLSWRHTLLEIICDGWGVQLKGGPNQRGLERSRGPHTADNIEGSHIEVEVTFKQDKLEAQWMTFPADAFRIL